MEKELERLVRDATYKGVRASEKLGIFHSAQMEDALKKFDKQSVIEAFKPYIETILEKARDSYAAQLELLVKKGEVDTTEQLYGWNNLKKEFDNVKVGLDGYKKGKSIYIEEIEFNKEGKSEEPKFKNIPLKEKPLSELEDVEFRAKLAKEGIETRRSYMAKEDLKELTESYMDAKKVGDTKLKAEDYIGAEKYFNDSITCLEKILCAVPLDDKNAIVYYKGKIEEIENEIENITPFVLTEYLADIIATKRTKDKIRILAAVSKAVKFAEKNNLDVNDTVQKILNE